MGARPGCNENQRVGAGPTSRGICESPSCGAAVLYYASAARVATKRLAARERVIQASSGGRRCLFWYVGWSSGMTRRPKHIRRWSAFLLAMLILAFASRDSVRFNVAEQAAEAHRFDLVGYQLSNFFGKWVNRLIDALPWSSLSEEEKRVQLSEYFELGQEFNRIKRERDDAAARDDASAVSAFERQLDAIRSRRRQLRDDVEETVESAISAVIVAEDLASLGELIFPPVDVRFAEPPKLLVTSRRDRIERTHDVLLESTISVDDRESLERHVEDASDLSAVVLDIGGLATFPASLPNDQPLRWTLQTSAHEWLHHYFFFRPLGQNMSKGDDMQVLNETIADIAGREIGDRAYQILGGVVEQGPDMPLEDLGSVDAESQPDAAVFDFNTEMRKTRLRVDELLSEGLVDEAEAYMEERRRRFLANGFHIRKLNQAYFAFHGTYADSPASVNPIGGQLRQMRSLIPDLGTFVGTVSGFSSYGQFLESLEALGAESAARYPIGKWSVSVDTWSHRITTSVPTAANLLCEGAVHVIR